MSYKKMAHKSQPTAWEQIHSKKYQDCPIENPTSFVCAEILYNPEVYELCLTLLKEQFYTVDFKWLIKIRSARLLAIKNTLLMLKTMFLP